MCVALYKKSGVKIPSEKIFTQCFKTNPDGAGFAVKREDGILISKGFFSVEDFLTGLEREKVSASDECFFHFRIATHGAVSGGCCHPFPLSSSVKELKKHKHICDEVLMHNGILSLTPRREDISDTMELCLSLSALHEVYREKMFLVYGKLEEDYNRLALMRRDGDTILTGQWYEQGGVMFSNLLWQQSYLSEREEKYDTCVLDYVDIGYRCDDCKHYGFCGLEYTAGCNECEWYASTSLEMCNTNA